MDNQLPKAQDCLRACPTFTGLFAAGAEEDIRSLSAWAAREIALGKVCGADIEVTTFASFNSPEKQSVDRLHLRLEQQLPEGIKARQQEHHLHLFPEVLYCRWAAPHTDNMFDKELFLNLVLGTGPGPYRIETLVPVFAAHRDGRRTPRMSFDRHSLEVKAGMVFLLDPLVPHYASPLNPHQDSLLSLLQIRLPYSDQRERASWLRQLSAPNRTPVALETSSQ